MPKAITSTDLRNLFQNPFNLKAWTTVLKNLFCADEVYDREPEDIETPSDDIEAYSLGWLNTDKYQIALLYYKFTSGSVVRRKVGLRQLANSLARRVHTDAALAVFDDGKHWRLSFICDLKEEKTSPKRYTFVFGDDQHRYHTAVSRFMTLQKAGVSFKNIKEAFSVEPVSKAFFEGSGLGKTDKNKDFHFWFEKYQNTKQREQFGYVQWYLLFQSYVIENKANPDAFGEYFKNCDDRLIRDYVKKLFGRIVFLFFLQKKGWMGCPSENDKWENGNLRFMQDLFNKSSDEQKNNFLDEILEPLFFDCLNTKRKNDVYDTRINTIGKVRIPYLNGGLFEKSEIDPPKSKFPADYFEHLFEFFDQYNFTIDENDPDDAEVGVDPEMLGHIFENLLEDNKDKGAYYTPKEIVSYMCRESLIAYLNKDNVYSEATIRHLVENHALNVDTVLDKPENKTILLQKLKQVKICDPAIGSGAFPMGLLLLLKRCRESLGDTASAAQIKEDIIQNNIYGVDIDAGAIDIARLRFWLSLIVDADAPKPLPNLNFKIMQGNSLLESYKDYDLSRITEGVIAKGKQNTLPTDSNAAKLLSYQLAIAIQKYYSATQHDLRNQLKQEIVSHLEELINLTVLSSNGTDRKELINLIKDANSGFFLWHTWFKNVFDNGGFDIVIGNPPYFQIKKGVVPESRFPYSEGKDNGKQNVYKVFIEHAYNICKSNGVCCLITQSSIMGDLSSKYTRELLITQTSMQVFVEFPKAVNECDIVGGPNGKALQEFQLFKNVSQGTCIFLFTKSAPKPEHTFKLSIKNNLSTIDGYIFENIIQSELLQLSGYEIPLARPNEFVIMQKLISNQKLGAMTSDTAQGNINTIHLNDISQTDISNISIFKGEHIRRYKLLPSKIYGKQTEQVRRLAKQNAEYNCLIVTQNVTGTADKYRIHATLVVCKNTPSVFLDTVNIIYLQCPKTGAFILGCLNSKLIDWFFRLTSTNNHANLYEILALPIPDASDELRNKIIAKVNELLLQSNELSSDEIEKSRIELDSLIYEAYGLDENEVAIIQKEWNRQNNDENNI